MTLRPRRSWVAAICQMTRYDASFSTEDAEEEEAWRLWSLSRTSSLSRRGSLRVEAKELAKVVLPVPGWPFIAINIGTLPLPSSSSLAISFSL